MVDECLWFSRHVIYANNKSRTNHSSVSLLMQIAYATTVSAPTTYLVSTYLVRHPFPQAPPLATRTWLGAGVWALSPCPQNTTCSLDVGPAEESEEYESDGDDEVVGDYDVKRRRDSLEFDD